MVLKLSGHLIKYNEIIKETLNNLKHLSTLASFVIIPGGSVFADNVRELQGKMQFSDDIAHWLAIKAMEMYGAYIASLDGSNIVAEAHDLLETYEVMRRGKIPVLMPYRIIREHDELPHEWSVTSDSIAVFIAGLLKANMIVFAKPVNGVVDEHGNIIRKINITVLRRLNTDVIDTYAMRLLIKVKLKAAIYNMLEPRVLNYIVNGEPGDYTLIEPS